MVQILMSWVADQEFKDGARVVVFANTKRRVEYLSKVDRPKTGTVTPQGTICAQSHTFMLVQARPQALRARPFATQSFSPSGALGGGHWNLCYSRGQAAKGARSGPPA